jgi:phosphoribosylanthranilate isomerase
MNALQIKICGITNSQDALECAAAGVDMIGLNFCRQSPRYITPDRARMISETLPPSIRPVGIFADTPAEEIRRVAHEANIHLLQLHGSETPEMCAELKGEFEIIKALQLDREFVPARASDFPCCTILLDTFDQKAFGGTGKPCDWNVARETKKFATRLILAGGLSPENVGDAVAAVNPYGVDVCSSLERAHGVKDRERLQKFVIAARNAGKLGERHARK